MLPSLSHLSVDVPSDVVEEIARHYEYDTIGLHMFIQVRQNDEDEEYNADIRIKLVNPDTQRDWSSSFGMIVNKDLGEQDSEVHNIFAKAFARGWTGVQHNFETRTDVNLYPRDIRLGLADSIDMSTFTGGLYFSLYSNNVKTRGFQEMVTLAKECTNTFMNAMRSCEPPFLSTTPIVDKEEHITSPNHKKITLERTCLIHVQVRDLDKLIRSYLTKHDP